jgi:hypothetical protein
MCAYILHVVRQQGIYYDQTAYVAEWVRGWDSFLMVQEVGDSISGRGTTVG